MTRAILGPLWLLVLPAPLPLLILLARLFDVPVVSEPLLQFALQLPLVAAFIWFALKIIGIFVQFIERQNSEWRTFYLEQSKIHAEGMARLAEEVKALAQKLEANTQGSAAMNAVLIAHDTRATEFIARQSAPARPAKRKVQP